MKINQAKLERQEVGVYRFINAKKYGSTRDMLGTLNYTMGVGKTYTAILIMKYLIKNNLSSHFVVVVPSEPLKIQWQNELSNHFLKRELNFIEIFTSSWVIKNNMLIRTDTLIADEIHEYMAEGNIKVINGGLIAKKNMLGLTGTGTDNPDVFKVLSTLCPIIDIIDEKEAIESNFISNFVEYNLATVLTDREKIEYDKLSKTISEMLPKFGRGSLPLANKCLSGGKQDGKQFSGIQYAFGWAMHNGWRKNLNLEDERDKKINDLWNPHKVIGYAKKLIIAIKLRKDILYSCENKVILTLELIKKFNTIKTIVFSQSSKFADKVGLLVNEYESNSAVVYHSLLQSVMMPSEKTGKLIKFGKKRLRDRAINRIKRGLSRVMCTVSSLDRGLDIEDIRLGITASRTKNPIQYKQRGGRVKRKETLYSEDTIVLIINLFVKDTRDEVWLKNSQSKSDHTIHSVTSIDDITFTPKSNFEIIMNDK